MIELPGLDLCLPGVGVREDRGGLDFQRLQESGEVERIVREVGTERVQRKRSSIDRGISQALRDDYLFVEPETVRLHVVRDVPARVRNDGDRCRLG